MKIISKDAYVMRLTDWDQIPKYLEQGVKVYYRHEDRQVVKYNGRYAVVDAETGEMQEPDIRLMGEQIRVFYAIIPLNDSVKASTPQVCVPHNVMHRLPGSIDKSDNLEARTMMRKRRHKEWFEDGQTQPSRKREGQAKSIGDIGFYVNKRGAFSVDEFAAIHERFKAHAIAKHAATMARLNK